jgi:hypothetical protein
VAGCTRPPASSFRHLACSRRPRFSFSFAPLRFAAFAVVGLLQIVRSPLKKLLLHRSPDDLLRILSSGSPLHKFDLTADGKFVVQDVTLCFTSSVGRAGLLHWIPVGSSLQSAHDATHQQALGRISDMLMKKKSAAFKSSELQAVGARDDARFALVIDSCTLSLEARSKEQRMGVAGGVDRQAHLSRQTAPAQLSISQHQLRCRRISCVATATRTSSTSEQRRIPRFQCATRIADSKQRQYEHRCSYFLKRRSGSNFSMYFVHLSTGTAVRQWSHIFFVPIDSAPDASGFLYFSTKPGDRTLHSAQRFALGSDQGAAWSHGQTRTKGGRTACGGSGRITDLADARTSGECIQWVTRVTQLAECASHRCRTDCDE